MNNWIQDEEKTGIENAKVTKKLWRQKPILDTKKMLISCRESACFSVNGGIWKVNCERRATFRCLLHLPESEGLRGVASTERGARLERTSEDQLIRGLKEGDPAAFGGLYSKYRSRIYRFALKLLQRTDFAEDIVQETFLKMHDAISTLDRNPSLASWLFAIARNEVYNHLRKERRNGQRVDPDEVWISGSVFEEVSGAETVEIVQRFIARLKYEYKEVLMLREYEGLSYEEISAVTGDTVSSVRSRLFKARRALTQKLKPYFGNQE